MCSKLYSSNVVIDFEQDLVHWCRFCCVPYTNKIWSNSVNPGQICLENIECIPFTGMIALDCKMTASFSVIFFKALQLVKGVNSVGNEININCNLRFA